MNLFKKAKDYCRTSPLISESSFSPDIAVKLILKYIEM